MRTLPHSFNDKIKADKCYYVSSGSNTTKGGFGSSAKVSKRSTENLINKLNEPNELRPVSSFLNNVEIKGHKAEVVIEMLNLPNKGEQ